MYRNPRSGLFPVVLVGLTMVGVLAGRDAAQARRVPRFRGKVGKGETRPPVRPAGPGTLATTPIPQPNFKISAGASNADESGSPFDFGDQSGLAFHGGKFYPVWSDNSDALPSNPDLPAFDVAIAPVTLSGTTVTPGVNSNISQALENQNGATVAVNPTNPLNLVVVGEAPAQPGLFKAYSLDGGVTWNTDVIGDNDGLVAAGGAPDVEFDQYGNCYLVYLGFDFGTEVALSTNGGQTFSPRATLGAQAFGFRDTDQPTVATGTGANGNGVVWVAWTDFQANGQLGNSRISAAGAQVTGLGTLAAFSNPQLVAGTDDANFGDCAVGPNGAVMVAFQSPYLDEEIQASAAYIAVDTNGLGGTGFGPRIQVTSTNVAGFDQIPAQAVRTIDAEVRLAWDRSGGADNGRVYLVYTDETPNESNNTDIYLRYSDNNGSAWSAPVKLNDDATNRSQFLPRIDIDQTTGNVAVVWYDCRNDGGAGSPTDRDNLANTDAEFWGTVLLQPADAFQFSSAVYNTPEGQNVQITVTRGDSANAASVMYAATPGTAAAAADFVPVTGTLNFASGQSSQSFLVTVAADSEIEGDETVNLTLSNPTGGVLGAPDTATLIIVDDRAVTAPSNLIAAAASPSSIVLTWQDNSSNEDAFQVERKVGNGAFAVLEFAPAGQTTFTDTSVTPGTLYTYRVLARNGTRPTNPSNEDSANITVVDFLSPTFTVSETAGSVTLTISRTGNTAGSATVLVNTINGTAAGPDDFTAPAPVVFGAGETARMVNIPVADDNLLEGNETFQVMLTGPTGSDVVGGALSAALVTILDDTARPKPTAVAALVQAGGGVLLTWQDNSGNEDGFEVERKTGVGGTFAVVGTTPAGTASFTDNTVQTGETYFYRVRAFRGALRSDYSDEAAVSVTTLQFSTGTLTVAENAGTAAVTITRTGDTSGAASVLVSSADGTAAAPGDYTAVSQTVEFAPGETTQTVQVTVLPDRLIEANETLGLTLSNVQGAGVGLGSQPTLTLTILDDRAATAPGSLAGFPVNPTSIRLTWTDNSENESGFVVERRTGAGAFTAIGAAPANATTFTDGAAVAGTSYTYRVRAVAGMSGSGLLESGNSAEVQVTVPQGGKVKVTPKKLNFGTVRLGRTKTKKVTIRNIGKTGMLAGTVGTLAAPFRVVSGGGPFNLAPRAKLTVVVEYAPTTAGNTTATLNISTTDTTKPLVAVPVTGKGR